MSFVNKVVLITGGSSGIGAATAVAFSKEGANVAIVGRNEKKLINVVEECLKVGNKPLLIKADITNEEEAERVVKKTVEAFGKIDVLVNNAGIYRLVSILDSDILKTYDLVMNTNLRAQIHLTHLTAPYLFKSKGNIINISSVGSDMRQNQPTMVAYSISKVAFTHFTRAAAAEFAPHGVRVNTISPGPVDTDILENAGIPKAINNYDDKTPLGRISESTEIADLILFLASEKAKAITGSNFVSDNGLLLTN